MCCWVLINFKFSGIDWAPVWGCVKMNGSSPSIFRSLFQIHCAPFSLYRNSLVAYSPTFSTVTLTKLFSGIHIAQRRLRNFRITKCLSNRDCFQNLTKLQFNEGANIQNKPFVHIYIQVVIKTWTPIHLWKPLLNWLQVKFSSGLFLVFSTTILQIIAIENNCSRKIIVLFSWIFCSVSCDPSRRPTQILVSHVYISQKLFTTNRSSNEIFPWELCWHSFFTFW